MTETQDPLLKGKGYVDPKQDSFTGRLENARTLLDLTEQDVETLYKSLEKVYNKIDSSKNAKTMIDGAIFALASRDINNLEWREHCAGSLRGLIDGWDSSEQISHAFCNTFNSEVRTGCPSTSTHPNEYKWLRDCFDYFSDIHHHNSTWIIDKLKVLYGPNMKPGCDTSERFIETAKNYLLVLIKLLKEANQ